MMYKKKKGKQRHKLVRLIGETTQTNPISQPPILIESVIDFIWVRLHNLSPDNSKYCM